MSQACAEAMTRRRPVALRSVPGRVTTGGYILHAGLGKWRASAEHATAVHTMAARAFPFLRLVPPQQFLRLLAVAEIATRAALLVPLVPDAVAGVALTGFSGALLAMYGRTPSLHKPGSIWPSPAGTAVSKDVWMLGVGLGLVVGAAADGRSAHGSSAN